ncbi:hypothetical protein TPHA_0H02130 [Tetrapisispora phaffii CBS 4417]|uniref:Uncharacterized protein n=1 Tax=Tetrapisispora phaffii (strain ATCC 24235 / CBS 4417 / NBRC 1672 / NRRL Y-8282 / UCD 70-5) TaxID=1071381 RepID=G8BWG6_TETPH|nr:hypothetical protein TPHA_0H02130 [Tetrapisispora phaffii CBS 4417]CCE64417.1 hypothetical protein TPHA_0H02130 [Tetrapisispora phaffii CBS 4417]
MDIQRLPLRDLSNIRFYKQPVLHNNNEKFHFHLDTLSSITTLIGDTHFQGNSKDSVLPTDVKLHNTTQTSNIFNDHSSNETSKRTSELKHTDDICNRLKIRLQFAFYKYQTNQIDKKFTDIKKSLANTSATYPDDCDFQLLIETPSKKRNHDNMGKISKKKHNGKRKLMMSSGNFFISHGKKDTQGSTIEKHHSKYSSQPNDSSINSIASDNDTKDCKNITGDTTIFTTPSSKTHTFPNNNVSSSSVKNKQETPMSVKAAKSLISLFTSNRN